MLPILRAKLSLLLSLPNSGQHSQHLIIVPEGIDAAECWTGRQAHYNGPNRGKVWLEGRMIAKHAKDPRLKYQHRKEEEKKLPQMITLNK